MNKFFRNLIGLTVLGFAVSCSQNSTNENGLNASKEVSPSSADGNVIPDQYIVQLKPEVIKSALSRFEYKDGMSRDEKSKAMAKLNAQVELEVDAWLTKNGIAKEAVIQKFATTFAGFAVKISGEKYQALVKSGDILVIEHDRMEYLPPVKVESIDDPRGADNRAQTTPCGITNGGGAGVSNPDRWIWIIDSGIDLDHPDLAVVTNTAYAKTYVGGTPDDCNGHGTHVAGTAAAKNNTIGVIGMAPGANVVPVRVFGCSGGSPTSTIISGINHVAANDLAGDVANLSLGGFFGSNCATSSNYLTAITSLAATSRVAIASGNNNGLANQYQPGCINGTNIFTVTNMRCDKTYYNDPTYGGNRGMPPVDWIATGTSVYSTYLSGGYATLTGTSMATPHVAGIMHVRNAAPLQNGTVPYLGVNYKIAVR